jgi:hypothetical protein
MAGRSELDAESRLKMFLHAVADHPWAGPGLIQSYSGLREREFASVAQPLALERGLVERVAIPAEGRAPRRFGLTPAGAAELGLKREASGSFLRDALLRALNLDVARLLLTEWIAEVEMIWSLSPYVIPATYLRQSKGGTMKKMDAYADAAYRSLRLDGLACIKFGPREFLNIAILVDPGDLKVDWLFHQFRSVSAWKRRPEFKWHLRTFPVVVVIAANDLRRGQLIGLWREAMPAGSLRMTTRLMLMRPRRERSWWNERGQLTALWGGVSPFESPCLKPRNEHWWGEIAPSEAEADPAHSPLVMKRKSAGVIQASARSNAGSARVIRDHLAVSARGREILDRVGQYPLISIGELAIVLKVSEQNIFAGMKQLRQFELVWCPVDKTSYVLTGRGLVLLAAQAGHSVVEYAELRRWPVQFNGQQFEYSTSALLASRDHDRLVLDFLVGLRRYGERVRLALVTWDHVQCLYEFPVSDVSRLLPSLRALQARVIPDAGGTVRVFREGEKSIEISFWLEIDRHGRRGHALMRKLARYYQAGSGGRGVMRNLPRLLVVVQQNDEARLRKLQRRFITLDKYYGVRLDARLTRVDLLKGDQGGIDPTRPVWRTPESSLFISAFDERGSFPAKIR